MIIIMLAVSYLIVFGAGIMFGIKQYKKKRNQYRLNKNKENKIVSFIEYKKYR